MAGAIHTPFARKAPISHGVARLSQPTVAVQIKSGRNTRIRTQRQAVGVGRSRGRQPVGQSRQSIAAQIVIESGQYQHIRIQRGYHSNNCRRLRIIPAQRLKHQPRPRARQIGVIGGNPQGFCP